MVAFGTPLQRPLSAITDQFAKLALDLTPKFVAIADTLAKSLEMVGPLFVSIVELLGNLLILLVPVIATIAGLAGILNLVVTPLAKFVSYLVDLGSGIVAGALEDLGQIDWAIGNLVEDLNPEFLKAWEDFWNAPSMFQYEGSELERLINLLVDFSYWINGNKRDTFEYTSEQKRFELQAERSAEALIGLQSAAEETTPALTYMQKELQTLGIYATSAEGNLIGLAGIFEDIDTAAKKSEASKALDDIGFSAGQIETILTKPDWYQIFADIAAAAAIATQDISAAVTSGNFTLVNEILKAQNILDEAKKEITSGTTGGGTPEKPRDAVKALFNEIRDEVNKQAAATKLAAMGASEGLIQLILGDKDWAKLWQQIKTGTISLKDLQKQFNNTAAGVKETEDALQAAAEEAEAYIEKIKDEQERLEGLFEDAKARADDFKKSMLELSKIQILPTITKEVGEFERQIVSLIESIREGLKQGFESGAIFEKDYKTLQAYAEKEAALLQSIARQRDDLANRYALSEALIAEYKSAFTSAASLTALFSKLKNETEKRTVKEITNSVARLSGSLKEFNVTVTREYEETIDKVVNKTEGLLNGFRDMATKARGFADNLRKLKDLGLNGELFNQLVQAGVEAGGETAQALVDGGSDTVNEINGLFKEINQLGADLGEDVAATMYGTGINMADGLLEGIRSKQSELETLARSMADAFNKEFQIRVSVAAQAPVTAAQNAYESVVVPTVDVEDLAKINALIANATRVWETSSNIAMLMGAEQKLDIYKLIKDAILGGAQLDLSGIVSGLSTAELGNRASALGVTNNITVNVATDATQSNAMVGQTIANVINNYTGKGGTLLSGVAL
jgi:predicted transcriptional regulator